MKNSDLNVLTDESIVKMAQEGSGTAYEYLIGKYKELAKVKSKSYFIAGADHDDVILGISQARVLEWGAIAFSTRECWCSSNLL